MPTPPMIFGVPIAQLVASNLGSKLLPATLTKNVATPSAYNFANPGGGITKTSTDYSCRAIVENMEVVQLQNEQTSTVKGKIMILLGSLSSATGPIVGDTITMIWPDGVTRTATVGGAPKTDPAGATVTCKVSA